MAKELKQRIIDSVQSGLNSTVQSLQAAVQPQQLGSAFYPTTLDQMETVRSGWLRKQGGIVRSWHRRFFVMKGDHIYYYASDDDCASGKPHLGFIFLPGNHVSEVAFSPADVEKFQFEIQTGDASRMSPTHETYLLAAETDDERKDWIRAIKRFLYALSGGAIFGQSLERTLEYEQQSSGPRKVPHIVQCCVKYLRDNGGLGEEGLFRLPGRNIVIKQLQDMFDRGERPTLTEDDPPDVTLDIHTVASLFKSYLRELPEPLIPYDVYDPTMAIVTREMPVIGENRAARKLGGLLAERLSPANYNTLQFVCQFLAEVAGHADQNKMNDSNLATVFAQCFLQPDTGDDDPGLMLATSANRTAAAQLMIARANKIFSLEYTPAGHAIATADLLGLHSRSSTFGSAADDASTLPASSSSFSGSQDLVGLEFGTTRSLTRHSDLTRPKPADRVRVASDGPGRRAAVILRDHSEPNSPPLNGTCGPAVDVADDDAGNPAEEKVSAEKPVVMRRAARSSSFDGSASSTLAAPVPPPKPNRQRAATNHATLLSQVEELTQRLNAVKVERDAAVVKAADLESKLARYLEKFGPVD